MEFVVREGEINRVGMVIRQVEEAIGATIANMKTEYSTEKKENKEINVTSFRVVFLKK